jgi:hypothetical protein
VETENNIKTVEVPKAVKDGLMKKNPSCKISEAEEVQTADKGKVYDVGCRVNAQEKEYRVSADGSSQQEIAKK